MKEGARMDIVDRIKGTVKMNGMTLENLYEKANLPKGYLRDVRAGKSSLTNPRLERIAEVLNTTVEYLRGETNEKNKPAPVTESEPKDNNDINLLVQFYKGFSEEQRKELVAEAFRIWQKEQNSN
jgi:transcriptional regulator with XRE-family HTH domain